MLPGVTLPVELPGRTELIGTEVGGAVVAGVVVGTVVVEVVVVALANLGAKLAVLVGADEHGRAVDVGAAHHST
ncbi:MAG: hypothetical protein EBU22_02660, partial [Actinobacteria bacterium]|nr:hypothetical protein [Actinomycetota bacterium]